MVIDSPNEFRVLVTVPAKFVLPLRPVLMTLGVVHQVPCDVQVLVALCVVSPNDDKPENRLCSPNRAR